MSLLPLYKRIGSLQTFQHITMLSRQNMTTLSRSLSRRLFNVEKEVQEAIELKKPVAALESTIIAHGMPFPQNLDLANELESILRERGVVPAVL